jgi:hypothetical protein
LIVGDWRTVAVEGEALELVEGGGDLRRVTFHLPKFLDYLGEGSKHGSRVSFRRHSQR